MFYNIIKAPVVIKTGCNIIANIDKILDQAHLSYHNKILVTQDNLLSIYGDQLSQNTFTTVLTCQGGNLAEAHELIEKLKGSDCLVFAFGGGSILDLVKYCATKCDLPCITVPSTLSNDAVCSCVARLTENGKKKSFRVEPPTGIIVDLEVVKQSPRELILAGVGDVITNLSATQDWKLSHKKTGESINELAYMLAKEAATPLLEYSESDIYSDEFLMDLTNGVITSGLSMMISGNTRGTSGSEHLIAHAIDEFFHEKSTLHGIQACWAFLEIEKQLRHNDKFTRKLQDFYNRMGLSQVISDLIPWQSEDLKMLIPYAMKIRNRYTIFNTL